ncbi:MAG: hypothetical protein LYZ70_03055 [Nitrososphaerales archaeon]|nr:hypothetical protein [Nitrososphaerales archaeon]
MRESKRIEKTRLPRNSYEVWSEAQSPVASKAKHRNPPEDLYEAWVKKRVDGRAGRASAGGKKARKAAT